jgi:recombination associated protein RdgC
MWFKNIQFYRLNKGLEIEGLEALLDSKAFQPCGKQQPFSYGWCAPMQGHSEQLLHSAQGYHMLCAKKQERVLPASVIKEVVQERILALENEQGYKVGRNQKTELKELVTQELLPKAFTRTQLTYAYLDTRNGWMIIDSASATKADDLVSLLRESIGQLPLVSPAVQRSPREVMTAWLTQEQPVPEYIDILDEAELEDSSEDAAIIRCKRQPLFTDEILGHINAEKQVKRLLVDWREKLQAVFGDDFVIRRIKFSDVLQEEASDAGQEDAAAAFDADFCLMAGTVSEFLPELLNCFGGEEVGLKKSMEKNQA